MASLVASPDLVCLLFGEHDQADDTWRSSVRQKTILTAGAFAILVGLALPARGSIAANHPNTAASGSFGAPTKWSASPFFGTHATLVGRVTAASGAADVVAVNSDSTWVMASNGTSFAAPTKWSSVPFYGGEATLLADVNGDGRADLVAVNKDSTWVMLSSGSSFGAPTRWSSGLFFGGELTLVGDINHDGSADLVAVNKDSTWVELSNGSSGFGAPAKWSSSPFYGSKATRIGDVTGDARADLVAVNGDSTWVMASSGTSFGAPAKWSSTPFFGSKATLLGDVNSDGSADLVAVDSGGTRVMPSSGTAFGAPEVWSSTPFFGSKATLLGDVSNDGRADLVAVNNDSTWVSLASATGAPPLAFQQTVAGGNTVAGTTFTLSGIAATGAHNLLVADVIMRTTATPSAAVTAIIDNQGNTWHKAIAQDPASVMMSGEIWYSSNAAAGVTSVTATDGASSGIIVRFYEFSGATTLVDQTATATGLGTVPADSGPTATTSQANEIAIGGIGWATSGSPTSPTAGWTITPTTANATNSGLNEVGGYQITSATGTFHFGATVGHVWVASVATFK
jgi:hypothetical protein